MSEAIFFKLQLQEQKYHNHDMNDDMKKLKRYFFQSTGSKISSYLSDHVKIVQSIFLLETKFQLFILTREGDL